MRWNQRGDALYTFSGGVGLNDWLLRLRVDPQHGRFADRVDTLLSLPTLGIGEFDIASDGQSLVYAAGGPVTTTIWALDLAEKRVPPRRLAASTSRLGAPTLSSDGQLVAYAATDQAGDNIYVMPFEGGNVQRITYDAAGYGATQWFPNRHRLMYQRWGPKEAFAQEFPRGARHLVARVEEGQGVLPLPDSGVVVQVAVHHLVFLGPDGARMREIVLPDSLGDDVSLWGVDGDGRSVYVRAISLAPYRPRLFRVDRASGVLALMGDLPIATAPMALGGRGSVLYATWVPGLLHGGHPTIWRFPPGGPAGRVRELPLECDTWTLSMALDERRFVCTASVSTSDIFLVQHIDTFRR